MPVASRGPTYPTIPHIALPSSAVAGAETLHPALDEREGRPAHGERARRHVPPHRRAGGDVHVVRHRYRGDELRVAADEHPRADAREMLLEAVVVARYGASADVAVGADLAVAQIGEVIGLRAGAQHRLLGLDEVADVHALAEPRPRPQPGERADDRAGTHLGLLPPAAEEQVDAVGERGVHEPRGAVEAAATSDAAP